MGLLLMTTLVIRITQSIGSKHNWLSKIDAVICSQNQVAVMMSLWHTNALGVTSALNMLMEVMI